MAGDDIRTVGSEKLSGRMRNTLRKEEIPIPAQGSTLCYPVPPVVKVCPLKSRPADKGDVTVRNWQPLQPPDSIRLG